MFNEVYKCDGQGGPQPPPGEGWNPNDPPPEKHEDEQKKDDQQEQPATA